MYMLDLFPCTTAIGISAMVLKAIILINSGFIKQWPLHYIIMAKLDESLFQL